MPLFLQLRLFWLFRVLIADSCELRQVIEERMNLEGLEDQAKLQMRPKTTQNWQNLRPKRKHQKRSKRSGAEKNELGGPVATTGWPWLPPRAVVGRTVVPLATHGRASPLPLTFHFSFRVAVRLPAVFAVFPLKYRMYLDILRIPNTLGLHSIFIILVLD